MPLDVLWSRLRALQFAPVLEHLAPLPLSARDDPLFGVDDALAADDPTAAILRGNGASIDRLEVRWDDVEPEPGVFDFQRVDDLLATSATLGFSVLAVVDGTPAWAVDSTTVPGAGPPTGLDAAPFLADGSPNPGNPWAFFLATISNRYGSRLVGWEIWNEPNSPEFWRGATDQYAQLLIVAHTVLSRQSPSAPVLIGGLVDDDGAFLKALMPRLCPAAACQAPFAAVAWHVYDNPAAVLAVAATTRSIMAPFRLSPAVWITEANVPVDDPESPGDAIAGPDSVTPAQQAAFVMQVYALARVANARSVLFYRASDVDDRGHYWGLLRQDLTARPALMAYRTAAQWLSGSRATSLVHPLPLVTEAKLCRGNQAEYVVWTEEPSGTTIKIPSDGRSGQLIQVDGTAIEVHASAGSFDVALPGAGGHGPAAVALGAPVILIVPSNTGC